MTNLNLEYEEYYSLLRKSFNTFKSGLWTLNKSNLYLGKVMQNKNIWTWNWISLGIRRFDVVLAKFRNGCAGARDYLYKIGSVNSPFRGICPNYQIETIEHFVMHCPKDDNARDIMKTDFQRLNISVNPLSISDLVGGARFSPYKR